MPSGTASFQIDRWSDYRPDPARSDRRAPAWPKRQSRFRMRLPLRRAVATHVLGRVRTSCRPGHDRLDTLRAGGWGEDAHEAFVGHGHPGSALWGHGSRARRPAPTCFS
jgi:hypothetical protein